MLQNDKKRVLKNIYAPNAGSNAKQCVLTRCCFMGGAFNVGKALLARISRLNFLGLAKITILDQQNKQKTL